MKHRLLPLGALALLLAASLWNAARVEQSVQRWCAQLDAVSAAAQQQRWDESEDAFARLCADWSRCQRWLRVVTVHDPLDEAQALFAAVRTHLLAREQSELQADVSALAAQLVLLRERERLCLENIL